MVRLREKSNGTSLLNVFLLFILIAFAIFAAFYFITNNKKVGPAKSSVQSVGKKSDNSSTVKTPSDILVFKEIGIQIKLSDELKGLTYVKNTVASDESYIVTTPDFNKLAQTCGSSAPNGFANVYKKPGQMTSTPNEGTSGLLKQFTGYYVGYGDPLYGNPCEESKFNKLTNLQAKLDSSLKSAFSNATEIE